MHQMLSLFLLQATEWASSEDTRRSCQSKGKTEVHAGGIWALLEAYGQEILGNPCEQEVACPRGLGEDKGSQWRQELDLRAELIQCGDVVGHSLASAMQLFEVNTPGATAVDLRSSIIFLPTSGGVSELCTSPDSFRPEGVHVRYQCLFPSVLQ